MKAALFRRYANQSPFGIYSNLWPSRRCRIDRETLGTWYAEVHAGPYRLSLWGTR